MAPEASLGRGQHTGGAAACGASRGSALQPIIPAVLSVKHAGKPSWRRLRQAHRRPHTGDGSLGLKYMTGPRPSHCVVLQMFPAVLLRAAETTGNSSGAPRRHLHAGFRGLLSSSPHCLQSAKPRVPLVLTGKMGVLAVLTGREDEHEGLGTCLAQHIGT